MDVYKHIIYVLSDVLYDYAWGHCDVLNQFIQRMNLLTNFPIFEEFV